MVGHLYGVSKRFVSIFFSIFEHWEHAIYGSGSFFIKKTDGKTLVISPIFFADENIFKTHFDGLKHWNTEFWRYTQGETPKTVKRIVPKGSKNDIHQIDKTEWLEIVASGSGFSFRKRIQWWLPMACILDRASARALKNHLFPLMQKSFKLSWSQFSLATITLDASWNQVT